LGFSPGTSTKVVAVVKANENEVCTKATTAKLTPLLLYKNALLAVVTLPDGKLLREKTGVVGVTKLITLASRFSRQSIVIILLLLAHSTKQLRFSTTTEKEVFSLGEENAFTLVFVSTTAPDALRDEITKLTLFL
jgi:hypothetical protein